MIQHANSNVEIGPLQGPRRDDAGAVEGNDERLMGTKAEARFEFIQERAEFASDEMLDV